MNHSTRLITHPEQPINRLLLIYGELALKGRNVHEFKERLRKNVQLRLRAEGLSWQVQWQHKRLYVAIPAEATNEELETALQGLQETAGLVWICPTYWIPTPGGAGWEQMSHAIDHLVALAHQAYQPDQSFRVTVNRADKRFPGRSNDLQRDIGERILEQTPWEHVALLSPDRNFQISIYPEGLYVFGQRLTGMGGLPVGSGGRLMTLLSGGIDSPVASWMMAKRGCPQDFIHFTASHQQLACAENNKVVAMVQHLSRYTVHSRLYMVPYVHFDVAMLGAHSNASVVLFRRFMARVAEELSRETGALALLNGDSLGQVASQTLENMVSKSRAVELPILRPLVGLDKQEIVAIAERIGTYETSIQPYKDCCALIESSPRTRTRHQALQREEDASFSDYGQLIQDSLADAQRLDFHCGMQVETESPDPLRQPVFKKRKPDRRRRRGTPANAR